MSRSLSSALSGLRAHQQWIDLIGNNLANANTPGYKTNRATFSSAFAQTLRFASAPSGSLGGVNPVQVGLGVQVSGTDRTFSQGALNNTGRVFDLALEGKGFFPLTDGSQRFFTRVGTFGLDAARNFVDQRTGFSVMDPSGTAIDIDVDALFPPSATGNMTLKGNLPAVVTGPLAEILTGTTGLQEGVPATLVGTATTFSGVTPGSTYTMELVVTGGAPKLVAVTDSDNDGAFTAAEIAAAIDAQDDVGATVEPTGEIRVTTDRTGSAVTLKINPGSPNDLANLINISTTLVAGDQSVDPTGDLNSLPANVLDYVAGDEIDITGIDTDGTTVNGTFTYGTDGTSIQDLITFIDGLYTDAQVTLNTSGQIVVTAQTPGETDLLLTINDDGAATGSTLWSTYAVSVTTQGTGPDTVVTSTEAYDSAGIAHTVTLTFARQGDLSWTVTASIPTTEGSVLQGGASNPITNLNFAEDGSPQGLGSVNSNVSILFNGQVNPQVIALDFGTDGQFDGLTQFGGQTSAFISDQDGFGDGELANINVDQDGSISGFYTNGQTRTLGSIGVATFANDEGLSVEGDNLFIETGNSGTANLGAGGVGGAGRVIGGALENSTVDTAEQFVRLIEAQRGFQANARVISVQDDVLNEVVNLI